jgi:hypothetical protein
MLAISTLAEFQVATIAVNYVVQGDILAEVPALFTVVSVEG